MTHRLIYTHILIAIALCLSFSVLTAHAEDVSGNSSAVTNMATGTETLTGKPPLFERRSEFKNALEEKRADYEEARDTLVGQRDQFVENRASTTSAIREKFTERRIALSGAVKERVAHLLGNVKRRMLAAIERFENIVARIETRADKLEERGVDITQTDAFLESARESLRNAKTSLQNTTETDVETVVDAESPRERFVTLQEKMSGIHADLKSAHESIRNAIDTLKKAITTSIADTPGTGEDNDSVASTSDESVVE